MNEWLCRPADIQNYGGGSGYLSNTRPDITFIVSVVNQFM